MSLALKSITTQKKRMIFLTEKKCVQLKLCKADELINFRWLFEQNSTSICSIFAYHRDFRASSYFQNLCLLFFSTNLEVGIDIHGDTTCSMWFGIVIRIDLLGNLLIFSNTCIFNWYLSKRFLLVFVKRFFSHAWIWNICKLQSRFCFVLYNPKYLVRAKKMGFLWKKE